MALLSTIVVTPSMTTYSADLDGRQPAMEP